MSSWNDVLQEQLMDSGNLEGACILGHDGACWATTSYFQPIVRDDTIDEVTLERVATAFNDLRIVGEGFELLGNYYTITLLNEQLLAGKRGFMGLYVVKTSQSFVFAVYSMNHQPGEALLTVEKFSQYLYEQNL